MNRPLCLFFTVLLIAETVCVVGGTAFYLLGCASPIHAQTPDCTTEFFYDGPTETRNYIQLATPACVITAPAEASMTLKFDHVIQAVNLQMGSNTGSELEWDFCLDIAPPGEDHLSECMQYDKHQDVQGNQHERRVYPVPLHLPAGTVLTLRRRQMPAAYCTHPGPYGSGLACATGQRVDLIGVLP